MQIVSRARPFHIIMQLTWTSIFIIILYLYIHFSQQVNNYIFKFPGFHVHGFSSDCNQTSKWDKDPQDESRTLKMKENCLINHFLIEFLSFYFLELANVSK